MRLPCPPPVHLPLIWYHGLTHPGDSRSSCTLTLPRHSGSLLSATIPSVNGLSPWNAFWLWLYMPFPWVSSCVSLYVSSFFLIFWFTFFLIFIILLLNLWQISFFLANIFQFSPVHHSSCRGGYSLYHLFRFFQYSMFHRLSVL